MEMHPFPVTFGGSQLAHDGWMLTFPFFKKATGATGDNRQAAIMAEDSCICCPSLTFSETLGEDGVQMETILAACWHED